MDTETAKTLVKVYAILSFVGAAIALIGGLIIMTLGSYMMMDMTSYLPFGGALASIIGVLLIAMAVLEAVVGWGLWTFKPWARVVAIIASALQIFSFPIGTIIGGFGIYLFGFEEQVKKLFK